VIGIGGSATVDGGCGMARALGFNLLDRTGTPLPRFFSGRDLSELKSIDRNSVMPELEKAEITVACDVTNPLLGPKGAAAIFAPQKGATAKDVRILEKNLRNYSETLIKEKMLENTNAPGDGAAGGLGAGLRAFCNAEIKSGAEIIMEITGLKKHLKDADILITGEGCTDSQTSSGKLCGGVAKAAKEKNVPAILLSGALEGNIENLYNMFTAVFSIAAGPCSLREAVDMAEKNLYTYGRNIAAIAKALGK
jgi:glycerate kinase